MLLKSVQVRFLRVGGPQWSPTSSTTYIADENGFQPTIEQGPGGAVPAGVIASLVG
ncbi:hypothetical protein ABMA27_015394 [Loxostege sticticalis]|uniref:Uncharacterized protein n=1 Tax=Loxostege sticticalis TaxID=481309 RepID=A0ABR3I7K6_LOXSC